MRGDDRIAKKRAKIANQSEEEVSNLPFELTEKAECDWLCRRHAELTEMGMIHRLCSVQLYTSSQGCKLLSSQFKYLSLQRPQLPTAATGEQWCQIHEQEKPPALWVRQYGVQNQSLHVKKKKE